MAQIKESAMRDAVLGAAFDLFSERGCSDTTMPQIARAAGVSTANIHLYFASKLEIVCAIFDPWLLNRLRRREGELASAADPRTRPPLSC